MSLCAIHQLPFFRGEHGGSGLGEWVARSPVEQLGAVARRLVHVLSFALCIVSCASLGGLDAICDVVKQCNVAQVDGFLGDVLEVHGVVVV